MKTKSPLLSYLVLLFFGAMPNTLFADNAVMVTIEADNPNLSVGQTTTVRVYGQIDPSLAPAATQIFSWYIDILNDSNTVAAGYSNVRTPVSDNTSATSGDGSLNGPNLEGIFDTFLLSPGAGKTNRVLLAQFQIAALTPGAATFSVRPGSTGQSLTDFLVSKTGGGSFTGGNYTTAFTKIAVTSGIDPSTLRIALTVSNNSANITFSPIPQYNHTVQFSNSLRTPNWINLPGGPHNSGTASENLGGIAVRYYRLALTPR